MKRLLLAVVMLTSLGRDARADEDDDALYACKPATGKVRVTLLPQASVRDLVTWYMGVACKTVVFSDDLVRRAGTITVIAPRKLSLKEAEELFVDALDAAGVRVVQRRGTVILKPGPDLPAVPSSPIAGGSFVPLPTLDGGAADDDKVLDFVSDIRKVDDTHVEITRAGVDRVLADPVAAARGARVVPALRDGKVSGFKLFAIRPSSLFARLGFANGDTVHSINRLALTSMEKALEIFETVGKATTVVVELTRRGVPLTLTFTVK